MGSGSNGGCGICSYRNLLVGQCVARGGGLLLISGSARGPKIRVFMFVGVGRHTLCAHKAVDTTPLSPIGVLAHYHERVEEHFRRRQRRTAQSGDSGGTCMLPRRCAVRGRPMQRVLGDMQPQAGAFKGRQQQHGDLIMRRRTLFWPLFGICRSLTT